MKNPIKVTTVSGNVYEVQDIAQCGYKKIRELPWGSVVVYTAYSTEIWIEKHAVESIEYEVETA